MASSRNTPNNSSQPEYTLPSTKSQVKPLAQNIVNNAINEALSEIIPEIVKGHDFKIKSNQMITTTIQNKNNTGKFPTHPPKEILNSHENKKQEQPRRTSSYLFLTPPEHEDLVFHTPPVSPLNRGGSDEIKLLYHHNQQKIDDNTKQWHHSEVKKTIQDMHNTKKNFDVQSGKEINERDSDIGEDLPLLSREHDQNNIKKSLPNLWKKLSSPIKKLKDNRFYNWFKRDKHYFLSSKFTNLNYRQNFASKMLLYKTIHMLCGYIATIIFQMTWTWKREIQNLGPPDFVRLVSDNFWMTYIILYLEFLYIGLGIAVRVFYIGRNMPFNIIIFITFSILFGFKCYALCAGLGQLTTAILTTVTYTLCLSYGLFAIILTLNKWPEKIDLTKKFVYHLALPIILITSPVSWMLNFVELKITDSIFQKEIGILGCLIEDYLPSTLIAYLIFMWEMFRIKRIVRGLAVSLPSDDEFIFGAFFI